MAKSVKTRIRLGTLFLFFLVILSGGLSTYYIVKLGLASKNVLKANYESLQYAHSMQKILDSVGSGRRAFIDSFDMQLKKQAINITEPGEQRATNSISIYFGKIKQGDISPYNKTQITYQLQQVLLLNMQAIKRKNQQAEAAAEQAMTLLVIIDTLIFIVGFTFAINFPSVLTAPIKKLTEAIKEISQKHYSHRIHINSKDEFGQLAQSFNEMAERLEYFENSNLNKLLFEKSRAEAVINSLKDASIGIDKNNHILFANYQALQLLGLTTDEAVGKPVDDLKKRNDLFNFLTEKEATTPFKIVIGNRENYFIKETIEVSQGDTQNKVIVLKNITSFKELDVAKTNFIATISHELKTPLASSDFSLKLLEDERTGALNTDQKELLQNIKQDNQRILKILSELLNMSQVETGRIQLNKQNVPPSTILKSAVETVASAAKEKGIELVEQQQPILPDIEVDAEKTTWVLNNFLTNAIKYSPNNSKIEIGVNRKNGSLIFSVKDNGPGIAKEYQHRLFERYYQVPGAKSKGTGLGLAISKDFIEAQGGKIWVESEIGQGAIFCFELPVNAA